MVSTGSGSTAASQVNSTSVPTPTDSLAGVRVAKDAGGSGTHGVDHEHPEDNPGNARAQDHHHDDNYYQNFYGNDRDQHQSYDKFAWSNYFYGYGTGYGYGVDYFAYDEYVEDLDLF